jgi:hypothetical protein
MFDPWAPPRPQATVLATSHEGCNLREPLSSYVLGFAIDWTIMSMRKVAWIAGAVGWLAVSCKDDGGDPQVADTSGTGSDEADEADENDENDENDDADPTTNPSVSDSDPDDSGPSTDDGPEPDTGAQDSSTGDPTDPIDPDALDDPFDDGALAGWSMFNDTLAEIYVEGGALHLEPGAWTVWLDDATAMLMHKPVSGDFKVTAAVTARSLSNPNDPPPGGYRFGGLMVRDPSGGAENYVFIVLGSDEDPSVETKTTVDSSSQYQGPPWPGASGEIRICRVGSTFGMYVRNTGGAWELSNSFDRGDLPDALEAGPIAYNNDATPNVKVSFDFVDFEPVSGSDECTQ